MDDIEEWLCADVVRLLYLDLFDLLLLLLSLPLLFHLSLWNYHFLHPTYFYPARSFFPLFNSHISTNELTLSRDC